jgi:hypothetical protein
MAILETNERALPLAMIAVVVDGSRIAVMWDGGSRMLIEMSFLDLPSPV